MTWVPPVGFHEDQWHHVPVQNEQYAVGSGVESLCFWFCLHILQYIPAYSVRLHPAVG